MTVVINSPSAGSTLSGVVSVKATYTGSGFNLATITIQNTPINAQTNIQPISFILDTTKLPNGQQTIIVSVRYKLKNNQYRWQKASVTVNVNNAITPPPPPPPPNSSDTYYYEDFSSGSFDSQNVYVKNGQQTKWHKTSSGVIDIVPDPRGGAKSMLMLETTTGIDVNTSEMAAFYLFSGDAYAVPGNTVWYRHRRWIPADYQPAASESNWWEEWHLSDAVPQNHTNGNPGNPASIGLGVFADQPVDQSLIFRVEGGDYTDPLLGTWDNPQTHWWKGALKVGHMYDFVKCIHWSNGPDGWIDHWVDGIQQPRINGANMFLTTSGQPDKPAYGLYLYHTGTPWTEAHYIDMVAVGKTSTSVGV